MNIMGSNTKTEQPNAAFSTDIVTDFAEFLGLRNQWQALEQQDPESTVFLTWEWMREAFRENYYRWGVVVVREDASPNKIVCIIPLKYRVHWSNSRNEFQTEIEAGGRLIWSEYTGFLCDPRCEKAALNAAANALAQSSWTKLSMRYVAQNRRAKIFMEAFGALGFSTRFRNYLINNKETDNLICPQVDLPEEFDSYLATQISRNKRQQYHRFVRQKVTSGEFEFSVSNGPSTEADIDELLARWHVKWVEQKGELQATRVAQNYRDVLMAARRNDCLFLPLLRRGTETLGALGHVLDSKNGLMHFIVAGRDMNAEDAFIGSSLHFFSINWAITNGYICYDFCHGNEPYKYGFGAHDQKVSYFEIRRKTLAHNNVFDPLCTGNAMKRIEGFLKSGKLDKVTSGCAQMAKLFS